MTSVNLTQADRRLYHEGDGSHDALRCVEGRRPGPRADARWDHRSIGAMAKVGFTRATAASHASITPASPRNAARSKGYAAPPLIVGSSAAMRRVFVLINQVASTNSTVLICGETGAGKEVVARNIHALSHLKHEVFLPVNCGAIPEHLLESQLF